MNLTEILTPYATAFRYPGDVLCPDIADVEEALNLSKELLPKSCKWHFQHLLPESTLLKCRRIIGRIGSYSSVFAV